MVLFNMAIRDHHQLPLRDSALDSHLKADEVIGEESDHDIAPMVRPAKRITQHHPMMAIPGTAEPINTVSSSTTSEILGSRPAVTLVTRKRTPTIAFAFDIDGVLVRGKQPLPGAAAALRALVDKGIPFILLTNGGGKTEAEHAALLSERLGGVPISERQFVQSHTPFRALVPRYRDATVLALGGCGDAVRRVAQHYGFRHVVTTSDIFRRGEHVHPFPEMTRAAHHGHGRGQSDDDDGTTSQPRRPLRIAAALVFSSPRDWCLDLQVLVDLLLSAGGVLGTRSPRNGDPRLPNCGYQQDGQPALYFCNPDFEWPTQHPHPRLAQGAFREALRGVWAGATRGRAELVYEVCGKPTETTYAYAEEALWGYRHRQVAMTTTTGAPPVVGGEEEEAPQIETVYMVGDNPESDICGANSYVSARGAAWKSVLVESGVHVAGSEPAHAPDFTVADVGEAVAMVLEMEGKNVRQEKDEVAHVGRLIDVVVLEDKDETTESTVTVRELSEGDSDSDGVTTPPVLTIEIPVHVAQDLPTVVTIID